MGIFDGSKNKQIEYLEDERKKLWGRLIELEKFSKELQREVQRKASDSEKDAMAASKKAAEFRNKTEARLNEASGLVVEITNELASVKKVKEDVLKEKVGIDAQVLEIDEISDRLSESETLYKDTLENLNLKISNLDQFLEKYPELDDELEEVDAFVSKVEDNLEKSNVSLTALNKRKKEIDDLHREIFGYSQIDDDGKATKVEGLKDELEASYSKLSEELAEALGNVEKVDSDYSTKYSDFEKKHRESYEGIEAEIRSLLPNALTAGLSAAFSSKKDEEVSLSEKLQRRFSTGIYYLLIISLIPFIASVVFLTEGLSLEEAILRLPRLVLAIVPMYIPALWFTYSANKKLNLSKRLIEEYSHKEVLSKTYEGLSTQIRNLTDSEQSEELKFRLLANFLQVSSENPGKLISNYEASDHPIMEALEQSYKFQIAIDRLEGIPGMAKVAAILETKSKRKLNERKEKIDEILGEDEVNVDEDVIPNK